MANALMIAEPKVTALKPLPGEAAPQEFKPDLARYRKWFTAYETNKSDEIAEAQVGRRYYNAKQWTAEEKKILARRGQAPVFDNHIQRKIDFLVGVEQRMRRDPKGYPRGPKDEKSADVATAGMRYACDVNRWETVASDATRDGLIDGIGVCMVGIKSGRNGNDPLIQHVQSDRFFYDPRSVKADFSDAKYMGLHLWMDIDDATAKWPDKATALQDLVDQSNTITALALVDQNRATAWGDFENRRVRVVEFWEKRRDGWYFCFFAGDVELDCGVSPYVDEDGNPDCPYEAWTPYVDEVGNRYGPIRNMKPMQDEINHRRSKFLHVGTSRQLFTRKGDLDDPDETRKQLHRPDGLIEHNGEWGKTTGIVDQSVDLRAQAELMAQSQASLENFGPNPGLIGKGGGVADQSGRAILAQRDSGMTELSPVFDRNRQWKLRVYRKVWARIKQAWTGEKWIRITDENDAPAFLGLNQYDIDPMTGQASAENVIAMIDVDIIMEEGPDTITMNEELLQSLQGNPAVPPKVLIELSNAPNKDRLFKLIDEATAPNPQVAAMQERLANLERVQAAAKVDKDVADAEAKRVDTLTKLANALTPKPAPTNEFGMPTGPAQQPPDIAAALALLQAITAQPTRTDAEEAAQMQPPQPSVAPDDGQMPQMNAMLGGPPPQIPQAAQGLPVDPQYGM